MSFFSLCSFCVSSLFLTKTSILGQTLIYLPKQIKETINLEKCRILDITTEASESCISILHGGKSESCISILHVGKWKSSSIHILQGGK